MGRFKGMSGVKTSRGGSYFQEGDHLVEVLAVKMIETRAGDDCFIVEGRVLESTSMTEGVVAAWVNTIQKRYLETIFGNIKAFAAEFLGIDDPDSYEPDDGTDVDDFWDESLEYMCSEEQPLKGAQIRLSCAMVKTKNNTDFTKHFWGPVVKEAPDA